MYNKKKHIMASFFSSIASHQYRMTKFRGDALTRNMSTAVSPLEILFARLVVKSVLITVMCLNATKTFLIVKINTSLYTSNNIACEIAK